jgi:hypothetical protein
MKTEHAIQMVIMVHEYMLKKKLSHSGIWGAICNTSSSKSNQKKRCPILKGQDPGRVVGSTIKRALIWVTWSCIVWKDLKHLNDLHCLFLVVLRSYPCDILDSHDKPYLVENGFRTENLYFQCWSFSRFLVLRGFTSKFVEKSTLLVLNISTIYGVALIVIFPTKFLSLQSEFVNFRYCGFCK